MQVCQLFADTVTVYRTDGKQVFRQVLMGCNMQMQSCIEPHVSGNRVRKDFTLFIPGPKEYVLPGDLIFRGIGPVISMTQWPEFIPAAVPELVQAEYIQPFYLYGTLHHTEVGSMRKNWR